MSKDELSSRIVEIRQGLGVRIFVPVFSRQLQKLVIRITGVPYEAIPVPCTVHVHLSQEVVTYIARPISGIYRSATFSVGPHWRIALQVTPDEGTHLPIYFLGHCMSYREPVLEFKSLQVADAYHRF